MAAEAPDGVQIRPCPPDDVEAIRAAVAVANAVRHLDSPWEHDVTEHELTGRLRHGWDGEPAAAYVAVVAGEPVATAEYAVSERDNRHIAWLHVEVHPDHRRRGLGTRLLDLLEERAAREGRTSVGSFSWDLPGPRAFAEHHGFEQRSVTVNRRQVLAGLDRDALDRELVAAHEAAAGYDLERCPFPLPAEELASVAVMTAAINDAPTDDLDIEDEVFDADRVAAYEQAHLGRDLTLYRLRARHRASGELAGQTVVAVDRERPHLAEQHDTSVVRAHRGHRLGALLKLEQLRWLAEAEPQVSEIDTWNAESNDHMIGVNELLGYRVQGRELVWQRPVRTGVRAETVG